MAWTEIDPVIKELTPQEVKLHRSRPHLPGDRDTETWPGKRRVKWLYDKHVQGSFFSPDWAIAEYNGVWYRVNGGHSSAMLASLNGSFPSGKKVCYKRFICETNLDLADLFNQFDSGKSKRTFTDIAKAHGSVHDETADIAPTWILKSVRGIVFYLNNGKNTKMEDEEKTQIIHDERDFIAWAEEFVKVRALGFVGVVAAMFRAYNYSQDDAYRFFDLVSGESSPDPKCPTRVLRKYLDDCMRTGQDKRARNRAFFGQRAQYVKCIHAWNAFQENRFSDLKYHETAPIPPMYAVTESGRRVSI